MKLKQIPVDSTTVKVVKGAALLVVGSAVTGTVSTLIHQNTKAFSTTEKVKLYVGAYALGGAVTDFVASKVTHRIDSTVVTYNAFVKALNGELPEIEVYIEETEEVETV